MKCEICGYENRDGIRFCEECGHELVKLNPQYHCPDCGHGNRPGVNYCEECGYQLETQAPIKEGILCRECGFSNRPDVCFCEECGHQFETQASQEERLCPECGSHNRPNVNFCEECGFAFTPAGKPKKAGGAMAARANAGRPAAAETRTKIKRPLFKRPAFIVGAVVVVGLVIFGVFYGRGIFSTPPIEDFAEIQTEIDAAALGSAVNLAEQWASWVDSDSGHLEMITTENGQAYMFTFESEPGTGQEGFSPRLIVLIDPITGEQTIIEAP